MSPEEVARVSGYFKDDIYKKMCAQMLLAVRAWAIASDFDIRTITPDQCIAMINTASCFR